MAGPDPTDIHAGIEKVDDEEYPQNALGRVSYTYRFDPGEFRKDRDFEVTWVDGATRFVLERPDHGDYWVLNAQPAGGVAGMKTGYEPDSFTSSTSGGTTEGNITISPAVECYRESHDTGDIIYAKTFVDLTANPFELDVDVEVNTVGLLGYAGEAQASVDTVAGYPVTRGMVATQLRTLVRHMAWRTRQKCSPSTIRETLRGIREFPRDKRQVYDSRVLSEVYDVAYLLGLREKTAIATSCHASGYTSVPGHQGEDKFGPVAQTVDELLWRLGRRDKPHHVHMREHEEAYQEHHEQQPPQRPSRPPKKPAQRNVSERDNTCPECEGRYLKKDLQEDDPESGHLSGTIYRCPDCDAIVGGDTKYTGPEPDPAPKTRAQAARRRGW